MIVSLRMAACLVDQEQGQCLFRPSWTFVALNVLRSCQCKEYIVAVVF